MNIHCKEKYAFIIYLAMRLESRSLEAFVQAMELCDAGIAIKNQRQPVEGLNTIDSGSDVWLAIDGRERAATTACHSRHTSAIVNKGSQ